MAEIKKITINGVEYDLGGSGDGTREVLIHNGQETCDFSLSTSLNGNTYNVTFPSLNNKYLQVDLETNAYVDNALGLGEDGGVSLTFPDMRNTKVYIYGSSSSSAECKELQIGVAKTLNNVSQSTLEGGATGKVYVSSIANYMDGSYITFAVTNVYNLIIILEFDEIGHCTLSVSQNNLEY